MRRSNQLVLAGVAFFVVGVIIVLLLARDDGGGKTSGNDTTPVLVAKDTIDSGTKGSDAVAKVEVKQVKVSEKQPTALTSPSQLSNARITASFAKGEQILSTGVTAAIATVEAPKGYEAVPVKVPFVGGGAGYIAPGDYVNVYQVYPGVVASVSSAPGQAAAQLPYSTPRAELLLTKVLVLDVNTQIASLSGQTTATTQQVQSRPDAGVSSQSVVVLALKTADVEKVIFGSQIDNLLLYLTKVDKDSAPAGPTAGQDYQTILQQEANDALAAAGGH